MEIPESDVLGTPCKAHVDCANQAACIEGICTHQCQEPHDWQCGGNGKVCFKWQCLDPAEVPDSGPDTPDASSKKDLGGSGKSCVSNIDCGGDGACIKGICSIECKSDSDCGDPADWDCKQFQCFSTQIEDIAEPDPGTPDPGNGTADTTSSPDSEPVNTDTGSLPPGCTEKKAPYGTTCFCKADCLSGLCLGDVAAGKGFCTNECFTSDNCPGTDWCYTSPEGGGVCVKNDAGANCNQACLSSLTLTNQQGQCICTVPCNSASQCPGTMACSLIDLGASSLKACVPIGNFCDPQAGASPCFGVCFPDLTSTFFCTATCSAFTDCPNGFKCHQETLGGQVYQTCLPQ